MCIKPHCHAQEAYSKHLIHQLLQWLHGPIEFEFHILHSGQLLPLYSSVNTQVVWVALGYAIVMGKSVWVVLINTNCFIVMVSLIFLTVTGLTIKQVVQLLCLFFTADAGCD